MKGFERPIRGSSRANRGSVEANATLSWPNVTYVIIDGLDTLCRRSSIVVERENLV